MLAHIFRLVSPHTGITIAAIIALLMSAANSALYGLNVANLHLLDNVAYWLSYRYWVDGVDLAGDIDYVRPILSPGILIHPFALLFDHPPHAVWAFNAVAAMLAGSAIWRYGRVLGLSERTSLALVALSTFIPYMLGVQHLALALTLWVYTYLHQGRLMRGAVLIPFAMLPFINPPFVAPAVVFGMLHLSRTPIPKRFGIGAGIVAAAAAGAIVYMLTTPQAAFENCGIKPTAWYTLVPLMIGAVSYKLCPTYFPHRLLFAAVIMTIATVSSPVEFHLIESVRVKGFFIAIPIVLFYMFRWEYRLGRIISLCFVIYIALIQILIGIGIKYPSDVEIAAHVLERPATQGLHPVMMARYLYDTDEYTPKDMACWR